jgi:hypothetical protein
MKVVCIDRGATVQIGDKFVHFEKGQIKDLPNELAEQLVTKSSRFKPFSESKRKNKGEE